VNLDLVTSNLTAPPLLFYGLGALAVLTGSDLEIPQPLPKLFSLYLLLAIGFRGGAALRHGGGAGANVIVILAAAVGAALLIPVCVFFALRRVLDVANAVAGAKGGVQPEETAAIEKITAALGST